MSQTEGKKSPRPFKSAEKPVSLYPLSFKQAVIALLQLDPPQASPAPADDLTPKRSRRTT